MSEINVRSDELIHVGDTTEFRFVYTRTDGTAVDFSASALTLNKCHLADPAGNVASKDASLYTDGTDGTTKYKTVELDWDEAGEWTIQGEVRQANGDHWHSPRVKVRVWPKLA